MFVIISYDIARNRTRTRLAKKLLDFGPRVQKSVFEADINEKEEQELLKVLAEVKLKKQDSIRFYKICRECKGRTRIFGIGELAEQKPFYIR